MIVPSRGSLDWILGKNVFRNLCKKALSSIRIGYQGDGRGGVTIPGSVQEKCECGTWECSLVVNTVVLVNSWTQ